MIAHKPAGQWRVMVRPQEEINTQLGEQRCRLALVDVPALGQGGDGSGLVERYRESLDPLLHDLLLCLTLDGGIFIEPAIEYVHYVKQASDLVLGRECFRNEIIMVTGETEDQDGNRWAVGHRTFLWYSLLVKNYLFRHDAIDRIPYLAPGLVGPEKAARGKTPTDVWWPLESDTLEWPDRAMRRILVAHSAEGDLVLHAGAQEPDFALAALSTGRQCLVTTDNITAAHHITMALAARSR